MLKTQMSSVRRVLCSLVLGLLAACGEGDGGPGTPDARRAQVTDPCGGICTEVELCAKDSQGTYGCARICANQLRCWSGCCLPLDDTGYNVCRPTNHCFPD
jgi:hypothetical protein